MTTTTTTDTLAPQPIHNETARDVLDAMRVLDALLTSPATIARHEQLLPREEERVIWDIGVKKAAQAIWDAFTNANMRPICPKVGQRFDPEQHETTGDIYDTALPGTIIRVVSYGLLHITPDTPNGLRVAFRARVEVSKGPRP